MNRCDMPNLRKPPEQRDYAGLSYGHAMRLLDHIMADVSSRQELAYYVPEHLMAIRDRLWLLHRSNSMIAKLDYWQMQMAKRGEGAP
jgi:hypothetical protein